MDEIPHWGLYTIRWRYRKVSVWLSGSLVLFLANQKRRLQKLVSAIRIYYKGKNTFSVISFAILLACKSKPISKSKEKYINTYTIIPKCKNVKMVEIHKHLSALTSLQRPTSLTNYDKKCIGYTYSRSAYLLTFW